MASKTAVLKQIQGLTFVARGESNHWVVMDGPESVGGTNAGSRPKELVLFAVAGCTASDVVSILKKKRIPVQEFEMRVSGTEREEHPKIFTDIHLEYIIRGENINPDDVKRAIDLSATKYCSVSAMLKPTVNITHSFKIESPSALRTTRTQGE